MSNKLTVTRIEKATKADIFKEIVEHIGYDANTESEFILASIHTFHDYLSDKHVVLISYYE